MKMKMKILAFALITFSLSSHASWTEFKEIGKLQTYGGGSFQVWLTGASCPNSKPYFTLNETYATNLDRVFSLVLMAKASNTKVSLQYNTADNSNYCYVTGIQIE